ncbi:PIG-L deacetylase family protein [Streptomyces sp. TRM49041]|uniref:PIG-L deacetylase family protein n=1 Tax=Streptomyces sp. TRM49041 TaxID=2603216 RepID=UPI0011EF799F|nr:PIG-L family deacetylase [Streptomyces sp. TRM49041]
MARDPLTALVDRGAPLVVLSPHLDDAVLSCGALMTYARHHIPVTVLTLFTEGAPPPYTLSARRYLHQTGACDAQRLYADRRAEDRAVLDGMGVTWRHAGVPEGLFRRKPDRAPEGTRRVNGLLPEPAHVYPTYRRHLTASRISHHDSGVLRLIAAVLDAQARAGPLALLAPLAVGGHADHLLARTAAELSGHQVTYYSDFPYNQHHEIDTAFTRRNPLTATSWQRGLDDKAALIRGYRTQADALFPDGHIPLVPEIYLGPEHDR